MVLTWFCVFYLVFNFFFGFFQISLSLSLSLCWCFTVSLNLIFEILRAATVRVAFVAQLAFPSCNRKEDEPVNNKKKEKDFFWKYILRGKSVGTDCCSVEVRKMTSPSSSSIIIVVHFFPLLPSSPSAFPAQTLPGAGAALVVSPHPEMQ